MPRTTETITFSLPPKMSQKIEKLMEQEDRNRSELLREALRRYIEEKEWKEILGYGALRAKKKGISQNQVEEIVDAFRK